MTRKTPPFAAWLLERFYCGPNREAVLGDMAERYQEGRTAVWYWKQCVTTLVVSAFADVRCHKVLALRAVIVACLGAGCLEAVQSSVLVRVIQPFVDARVPSYWWNSTLLFLLYEVALTGVFGFVEGLGSGWIATRLYQRRRAIVLPYSFVVSFIGVASLASFYITGNVPLNPQALAIYGTALAALNSGILLGGLWRGTNRAGEI